MTLVNGLAAEAISTAVLTGVSGRPDDPPEAGALEATEMVSPSERSVFRLICYGRPS
jgi:hypothetical protein